VEDKDYLLNFIIDEMEDKSEYYKTTNMIAMIFSYTIKKGKAKDKDKDKDKDNIRKF